MKITKAEAKSIAKGLTLAPERMEEIAMFCGKDAKDTMSIGRHGIYFALGDLLREPEDTHLPIQGAHVDGDGMVDLTEFKNSITSEVAFAALRARMPPPRTAPLRFTDKPDNFCVGIEVVTSGLIDRLAGNIDPQHGKHKSLMAQQEMVPLRGWLSPLHGEAAIEYVWRCNPAIPTGFGVFIERPDLDSVGAAALLYFLGMVTVKSADPRWLARIKLIADTDRGLGGDVPWVAGGQFVDAGSHVDMRGLARLIADRALSLADKVEIMGAWLIGGHHPMIDPAAEAATLEMEDGRRHATITHASEPVVLVQLNNEGLLSRGRGACAIGYKYQPVVVAVCDDFEGRGWTGRKFTIALHPGGPKAGLTVDWARLIDQIGAMEVGWGGNTNGPGGIIGSPMSGPSKLTAEQVLGAVKDNIRSV